MCMTPGLKILRILPGHAKQFSSKIYGIEPGNDGNRLIQDMIDADAFDLKDFKLVESSEQGMISQVKKAVKRDKWIVFLGWEPHPMNTAFELAYLEGGDKYFGPNLGGANDYTTYRKGFAAERPNVGKFLSNLKFSLNMENQIMSMILDQGMAPEKAAETWLSNNPDVLDGWIDGVTTSNGKPGLGVVKKALKK